MKPYWLHFYVNEADKKVSVFEGINELSWRETQELAAKYNLPIVEQHHYTNIDDINDYLTTRSKNDPTFEGVVLRDNNNLRFKIKTIKYLELHRLSNNGNLASPKNLINFILRCEEDEVLSYFPSLTTIVYGMKEVLNKEWVELSKLWQESKNIVEQKDFALYILPRTQFSGLLFQARKGVPLEDLWRESGVLLVEKLFKE
jgi:hypothetical protein